MSIDDEKPLLLITGPAGAGRTTTIHALEDIGYEAIDNLPIHFLSRLLQGGPVDKPLAIGIDTRTRGFVPSVIIDLLNGDEQSRPTLVYLDCDEETLLRRFTETRRRHPLAPNEAPIVGIRRETEILGELVSCADILIDTSDLSPHDLKAEVSNLFDYEKSSNLAVSVQSFSYKRGTPRGIDMIIDCRFLQNPHWQDDLRALDGKNEKIAAYVQADPLFQKFFQQLSDMCKLLLPAYQNEGKAYFSIGLGCSGGKHRSVLVTEMLGNLLAEEGWQVSIRHRELDRHTESLATRKGNEPK